jgi:hypothetical protein
MSSLKGYIPTLARLLDLTPDFIYERQRALVKFGILETAEGRGPGSGVKATDASMSILLVSLLAGERLTELNAAVFTFGAAKCVEGRCLLTKADCFAHAIRAILAVEKYAEKVDEIEVIRTDGLAAITFNRGSRLRVSLFQTSHARPKRLKYRVTIPGDAIRVIAGDTRAMLRSEHEDDA